MTEFINIDTFNEIGNLGAWWNPFDLIGGEKGNQMPRVLANELHEKLTILWTRAVVINKLLVNRELKGIATRRNYNDYNKVAKKYNSLVDEIVKKLQLLNVTYPYKFVKVKTTSMSGWKIWSTWSKDYSPSKGLHGFSGFGAGPAVAAPAAAGVMTYFGPILVVLSVALIAYLGWRTVELFKGTEKLEREVMNDMRMSARDSAQNAYKRGDITKEERDRLLRDIDQKLLDDILGAKKKDPISQIGDTFSLLVLIGGVGVLGYIGYSFIKKKKR